MIQGLIGLFLIFTLFATLFFILISAIFIIRWFIRRHKGKTISKSGIVIPTIVLVFNLVVLCIPIGIIGTLRMANHNVGNHAQYEVADEIIYWNIVNNEEDRDHFEYNGDKYVKYSDRDNRIVLEINKESADLSKPIATLRSKDYKTNSFNEFMYLIFSGSTSQNYEGNVITLYPIPNDQSLNIFFASNYGSIEYLREQDVDTFFNYYSNAENFDTKNVSCEYRYYKDGLRSESKDFTTSINNDVLDELIKLSESSDSTSGINIGIEDINESDVKFDIVADNYNDYFIKIYSNDGATKLLFTLVEVYDKTYLCWLGRTGQYTYAIPLSDDISNYLINDVFKNN